MLRELHSNRLGWIYLFRCNIFNASDGCFYWNISHTEFELNWYRKYRNADKFSTLKLNVPLEIEFYSLKRFFRLCLGCWWLAFWQKCVCTKFTHRCKVLSVLFDQNLCRFWFGCTFLVACIREYAVQLVHIVVSLNGIRWVRHLSTIESMLLWIMQLSYQSFFGTIHIADDA